MTLSIFFRIFVASCLFLAGVSVFLIIGAYDTEWRPIRTPVIQDWLDKWHQHADSIHHIWEEHTSASEGAEEAATTTALHTVPSRPPTPHNGSAPSINATHPETILVVASMSTTSNDWISDQLTDLLGPSSNMYTALYIANDQSAALHTPQNKGHEAMSYLTYIIDFYDKLPPISIFLHGHPTAWHNNYLLNLSTPLMLSRLNRTLVLEQGYLNLRCHWGPGCPSHLNPYASKYDDTKREELLIKPAWDEMFPAGPRCPTSLSQPCCSQFAVTAGQLLKWPREKYEHLRTWLATTDLTDFVAGRVFEYTWQFLFTPENDSTYCPDPRICYCQNYDVCFEDPRDYVDFFYVVEDFSKIERELQAWKDFKDMKDGVSRRTPRSERSPSYTDDILRMGYSSPLVKSKRDEEEEADSPRNHPVTGGPDAATEGMDARMAWLRERMWDKEVEMERRKEVASAAGRDPQKKAKALRAAKDLNGEDLADGPDWLLKEFRG